MIPSPHSTPCPSRVLVGYLTRSRLRKGLFDSQLEQIHSVMGDTTGGGGCSHLIPTQEAERWSLSCSPLSPFHLIQDPSPRDSVTHVSLSLPTSTQSGTPSQTHLVDSRACHADGIWQWGCWVRQQLRLQPLFSEGSVALASQSCGIILHPHNTRGS